MAFTANAQSTLEGDMNHDGELNITDVMLLVEKVLHGSEPQVYLTCPDSNHPHLIDLGLPEGTLWACCNVGASKPKDYGGHYAWGETEEKTTYNWSTYIYCNGTFNSCYQLGNICGTKYDVAHVKWGGSWQMPTKNDRDDLDVNCTYEVVTINGVQGRKYIGPNGGSIFLPNAGTAEESSIIEEGTIGYYWTGTPVPSYSYLSYYFHNQDGGNTYRPVPHRYFGHCVRPVWV